MDVRFFCYDAHMQNQTNKKVIVITGASSGLGKSLALQAAKRGYDVAVADVQVESGQKVAETIRNMGQKAEFFNCNVAETKAVQSLKEDVVNHFGQVDVIVNNAGVGSQGNLEFTTEAEWERQWQINVMGVVRGCQTFIPEIRKSNNGAIVNVASFAAIALAPGVASYNVAKAGVYALSETLRCELAADGIHVSVVCPAFFQTNLVESMHGTDEKIKNQINRWMSKSNYTADDVANMMLDGIENKQFLILCDSQTKWQTRLSRWFPNFFYKQKLKMIKRMFK